MKYHTYKKKGVVNRRSIDDHMKVLCICRMLSLAHQQNEFEVDSSMPWCYCERRTKKCGIALIEKRERKKKDVPATRTPRGNLCFLTPILYKDIIFLLGS